MSNPSAGGSDFNNVEKLVKTSSHESSTELHGLFWTFAAQDILEKVSGIGDVLKPSWGLDFWFWVLGAFGGEGGAKKKLFLIITNDEQNRNHLHFCWMQLNWENWGKSTQCFHNVINLATNIQLHHSDHASLATLRAGQNDPAAAWRAALSDLTYGMWVCFPYYYQQSVSIIHQGTHWKQAGLIYGISIAVVCAV